VYYIPNASTKKSPPEYGGQNLHIVEQEQDQFTELFYITCRKKAETTTVQFFDLSSILRMSGIVNNSNRLKKNKKNRHNKIN